MLCIGIFLFFMYLKIDSSIKQSPALTLSLSPSLSLLLSRSRSLSLSFFSLHFPSLTCELICNCLSTWHLTFVHIRYTSIATNNDLQNWRWHKTINGYESREQAEKTHLNESMLLLSTRFANRCWYAMFLFRFPADDVTTLSYVSTKS